MLCETWQLETVPGKLDPLSAAFKSFSRAEDTSVRLLCKPRSTGERGGGLAFVFKSSLNFSFFNLNINPESFEFMCVKFKGCPPCLFVCFYRRSSVSFVTFRLEFAEFLDALNLVPMPCFILGDFNVKINNLLLSETRSFCSICDDYNFTYCFPSQPTHTGGNTLDFLVVNCASAHLCSELFVHDDIVLSDHFPVSIQLQLEPLSRTAPPRCFRSFASIIDDDFSSALCEKLDAIPENVSTFSELLSSFNNACSTVVDQLAPLRTRRSVESHAKPFWMDSEYIHQRQIRKNLQKLSNKSQYNAQKRHCAYLARKKQREVSCRMVDEAPDQKSLYSVLNKITGKNVHQSSNVCSSPDLPNVFNRFFVDKVSKIRNAFFTLSPPLSETAFLSNTSESGFLSSFLPTDESEICLILKEHGIKTSSADPLPHFLIKKNFDILLPFLVRLVNLSLSSASLDGLKEAHVVPILKGLNLDGDDLKNFRPVSLLPFVSKLTERVVHARINTHLTENGLHNPSQYGYKKNHSCETLLLKLIDDILVAVDSGSGVVLLIVDLSAAFDCVDHNKLLDILFRKYKITGVALSWLRSFLSGRSQRVKLEIIFLILLLFLLAYLRARF